jgi:hypothetical protein
MFFAGRPHGTKHESKLMTSQLTDFAKIKTHQLLVKPRIVGKKLAKAPLSRAAYPMI